jgi:hypothetical protein
MIVLEEAAASASTTGVVVDDDDDDDGRCRLLQSLGSNSKSTPWILTSAIKDTAGKEEEEDEASFVAVVPPNFMALQARLDWGVVAPSSRSLFSRKVK